MDVHLRRFLRDIRDYKLLSPEEERELLARKEAGSQDAREKLILCNLGLVINQARKFWSPGLRPGLDFMDLVGEGIVGLIRGIDRFKLNGNKLSTYVHHWIDQAIRRAIIKAPILNRTPTAWNRWKLLEKYLAENPQASADELADYLGCRRWEVQELFRLFGGRTSVWNEEGKERDFPDWQGQSSPVRKELLKWACKQLESTIDLLPEREAAIIRLRYGIDTFQPLTLEEVGRILGISRERVRQLQEAAEKKLREKYLHQLDFARQIFKLAGYQV